MSPQPSCLFTVKPLFISCLSTLSRLLFISCLGCRVTMVHLLSCLCSLTTVHLVILVVHCRDYSSSLAFFVTYCSLFALVVHSVRLQLISCLCCTLPTMVRLLPLLYTVGLLFISCLDCSQTMAIFPWLYRLRFIFCLGCIVKTGLYIAFVVHCQLCFISCLCCTLSDYLVYLLP